MALRDHVERIYGGIGDVNFPEYSGGFVFKHDQGGPEIEWVEPPCDDVDLDCPECAGIERECGDEGCESEECDGHGAFSCVHCEGTGKNPEARWTVYRVLVEAPDWCDLDAVEQSASYSDVETSLQEDLDSCDVMRMAMALWTCAGHYGWHEWDEYPLSLTLAEVTKRYEGISVPAWDQVDRAYWPEQPTQLQLRMLARKRMRKGA